MAIALVVVCLIIKLSRRAPFEPLQTFLLYPNYRGMMFSDQSQAARVAIDVNPLPDKSMVRPHVVFEVMDPAGRVLSTVRLSSPVDGSMVASIDMGGLPPGRYRLRGLLEGQGNTRIFAPSSHSIIKVASEARASMKAWIDSDNTLHMGGRPRFVIIAYRRKIR